MKKRMISFFLSFVLVVALLPLGSVVSSAADDSGKVFHYLSLGASNTNGFGLDTYYDTSSFDGLDAATYRKEVEKFYSDTTKFCGYKIEAEGSYPVLLKEKLEESLAGSGYTDVELSQYAICGMRMEELRMMLDSDYYGDTYTKWRFYDENGGNPKGWFVPLINSLGAGSTLETLREDYRNEVREADLITMDLGMNNFCVYLVNQVLSGMFDADYANIYGEEEATEFYECREKLNAVIVEALSEIATEEEIEATLKAIEDKIDAFSYAYLGFAVNYEKCISLIRELNPDAEIVLVGMMNILEGMKLEVSGIEIPFGKVYGVLIQMANAYALSLAMEEEDVIYVDTVREESIDLLMTELEEYDGTTVTTGMKNSLNLYDSDLAVGYHVQKILEEKGYSGSTLTDLGDRAKAVIYDILVRIMKAGIETDTMILEEAYQSGDYCELMTGENHKLYADVIETLEKGETFDSDAYIESVLAKPGALSTLCFAIRYSAANCFYTHPSLVGYQQIADLIWERSENLIFKGVADEQIRTSEESHASKVRTLLTKLNGTWNSVLQTEESSSGSEMTEQETRLEQAERVGEAIGETVRAVQSAVESRVRMQLDVFTTRAKSVNRAILSDAVRGIVTFWEAVSPICR